MVCIFLLTTYEYKFIKLAHLTHNKAHHIGHSQTRTPLLFSSSKSLQAHLPCA